MLLHDAKLAIETLARLRALGVRIALDDFGTGYSSLSYLRHLPADALKIDRSFLVGIASDDAAAALTASIVAMGVALGLRVVAEGVEDEQQRRLLKAWGCHEAQGFLFGRAVPADEAERTWAARVHAEGEGLCVRAPVIPSRVARGRKETRMPRPEGRLEGRVAVITGGASGMGRSTVLRFLDEGASIVVADLNEGDG